MENTQQPPAPPKERESIRKYRIEFALVFAAIVLGFFAENMREYYSDRDKEHEFAQLLLEDLRTDSVNIARTMDNLNYNISVHDSILAMLKKETYDQRSLLIQLRQAGSYGFLLPANTTIEQLKGSGSAPYFTDKRFVSSVLKYYRTMGNVEDRTRWLNNYTLDLLEPFQVKHVNRMSLTFISQDSIRRGGPPVDSLYKATPMFNDLYLELNTEEKIELFNLIWSIRLRMSLLKEQVLPKAHQESVSLIQQIKREYNLN